MNPRSVLTLLGPFLALMIVYSIFGLLDARFFSPVVTMNILTQTVIVGTAAIGMTLIIISGGIDLSVGSMVALSGVFCAWLVRQGLDPLAVFAATIAFSALCGA